FVEALDHFGAEGVHLGAPAYAEDAIAEVPDHCVLVLPEDAAFGQIAEGDEALRPRDRVIAFAFRIVVKPFAIFDLIEAAVAVLEHFMHPRRDFDPGLLHVVHYAWEADGIPCFEGAEFPAETGAHGIV